MCRDESAAGVDAASGGPGQRGAVVPAVALVLAALLIGVWLIIGVSERVVDRARAQSAADAAALAGVAEDRAAAAAVAGANGGALISYESRENWVRVVVEVEAVRAVGVAERRLTTAESPDHEP